MTVEVAISPQVEEENVLPPMWSVNYLSPIISHVASNCPPNKPPLPSTRGSAFGGGVAGAGAPAHENTHEHASQARLRPREERRWKELHRHGPRQRAAQTEGARDGP